jgi:hypothetical protein
VSENDPISCSSNDGSVEVLATGGKEPYTYSKDEATFQSSRIFLELGGGNFTITVKDKNGCTKSSNATLTIPGGDPLTATADLTADTECLESNGSIQVNASGGTPPYQYKRGSGVYGDVSLFEGLAPGSYTIFVKDDVGCEFSLSAAITQGATGITYDGEIKAIFQAKCLLSGCHLNNANGQGDWGVYSQAFNKRTLIKSLTQSGIMPKEGSLTPEQKALIACWVDGGAPEN